MPRPIRVEDVMQAGIRDSCRAIGIHIVYAMGTVTGAGIQPVQRLDFPDHTRKIN